MSLIQWKNREVQKNFMEEKRICIIENKTTEINDYRKISSQTWNSL